MKTVKNFFSIEPEVSGEFGENCMIDTSVRPPKITKLQYKLTDWLGDDIFESFPCFIVTEHLANEIILGDFIGFELDDVDVVTSEDFAQLHPGQKLPLFIWLRVTGKAGVDDFGVSSEQKLIVSGSVLEVLKRHNLSQCDIKLKKTKPSQTSI